MNNQKQWWGKGDSLLILGLAFMGMIAWLVSRFGFVGADAFLIKSNNNGIETIQTVTLDSDKTITIKGQIGEMKLEFKPDKGARVASSTCPCQVCVNSGWSRTEALICVPNGIIIQPKLNNQNPDTADAVTR